jgi:hypothetical protein
VLVVLHSIRIFTLCAETEDEPSDFCKIARAASSLESGISRSIGQWVLQCSLTLMALRGLGNAEGDVSQRLWK